MSWDELQDAVRRRVQTETDHRSTASLLGSIVRLAVIAGVLVAAIVVPATAIVAVTVGKASNEIIDLPLTLDDRPSAQTSKLLAADGQLIAYFYDENRQDVPLEKIAPVMKDAILAIEDNRFYDHGALDLEGTLRAAVNNASEGQTQGGSTITQQLVKQTLVQQAATQEERKAAIEQSVSRKLRELKLAIDLEKRYSKDAILEKYLNIAYYGDGAYGIAAAASHFFSVAPDQLTAAQAATLAGLVKSPVELDPTVYPEKALQRRNTVLLVMERLGKISEDESTQLQASGLDLAVTEFPNGCITSSAQFSCDYVEKYLSQEEALGATPEERAQRIRQGGLTIKSNIDLGMQAAANDAVTATVLPTDQAIGALAMVEPGTGKVKSVAQSRPMGTDKGAGQTFINFTVPWQKPGDAFGFQAGSTFKLFTTAAALKEGIDVGKTYNSPARLTMRAGTYFDCEGGGTGTFPVKNSTSSGTMNMYSGLRLSVNTYYAQLERDAGLCNTVRMAEAMGIEVPFEKRDEDLDGDGRKGENGQVPSLTLGPIDVSPLDMAAAYATTASGGMYCKPQPVAEILDKAGKVIKSYQPECERVLSTEQAAQINDILRGLQQPGGFGFSNGTGLTIPSAAKTGTTNSSTAVWYVGYTPELATASMIAGANGEGAPQSLVGVPINGSRISFNQAGGSSLAGPMWAKAMKVIQETLSPVDFQPPPKRQPVAPQPNPNPNPAPDPNAPQPGQQPVAPTAPTQFRQNPGQGYGNDGFFGPNGLYGDD